MTARRLGIAGIAAALLVPLLVAPSPAAAAPRGRRDRRPPAPPTPPPRSGSSAPCGSPRSSTSTGRARRPRPTRTGSPPEAEYLGWLDLAQRLHHNAVFVQVRPDRRRVLAVAVRALVGVAHRGARPGPRLGPAGVHGRRGAQARTWSSTPGSTRTGSPCPHPAAPAPTSTKLAPGHPVRKHPDWAVAYPVDAAGSRLYYNPGIPEARQFVADRHAGRGQAVRHRRRALRRLLLPVPGGAGQDFRTTRRFARVRPGLRRPRPTGGGTTSTCWSRRWAAGSRRSSRG